MNKSAQQHLTKAKDYVARGEEFYRKAAEEIATAKESDPSLTWIEIGRQLGKGETWPRELMRWHESGARDHAPFGGPDQGDRQTRSRGKKFLREAPPEQIAEIIAEIEPRKRQEITQAIGRQTSEHQVKREQLANEKLREKIGDETVDDLEFAEKLKSTEYLLISARGNLRGFVRQAGEIGESSPEGWRESCLDWIEDLEGHLGMARALLAGDNIDWSAFEDMLEQEGR